MSKKRNWKVKKEWGIAMYHGEVFGQAIATFKKYKRGGKTVLQRRYDRDSMKEEFGHWTVDHFVDFMRYVDNKLTTSLDIKSEPSKNVLYDRKKEMEFYREQVQWDILKRAKAEVNEKLKSREIDVMMNAKTVKLNALNGIALRLQDYMDKSTWKFREDVTSHEILQLQNQLNRELGLSPEQLEVVWDGDIKSKLKSLWIF